MSVVNLYNCDDCAITENILAEGVIKTKLNDVRRDLMTITGCRDIQIRQMGSAS